MRLSKNYGVIANVTATLLVSCFLLFSYVQGPLGGDFKKFMMTSQSWGVPNVIAERGVEPLYLKDGEFGWDGQFYYYMANDPFANSEITENFDNAPYRYQRIGVPLIAFLFSKVLFQSWVSPELYYLTNLFLLLAGIAVLSLSLINLRRFWFLPLAWSLSSGTQVTLLNGLIDPGADGLLALTIFFLLRRMPKHFLLFGCFAVLSKEIFVVLPLVVIIIFSAKSANKESVEKKKEFLAASAVMLSIWISWQLYLKFKFKVFPLETTKGTDLVDLPFYITLKYMTLGLLGTYPRTPEGKTSYNAGIAIVVYVIILFGCMLMASMFLRKNRLVNKSITLISTLILILGCVFLTFGDTVMYNFSGYMKALSTIILLSIFLFSFSRTQISSRAIFFSVLVFALYSTNQVWTFRVDLPTVYNSIDKNCGHIEFQSNSPCREKFSWPGKFLPRINGKVVQVNNNKAVASDVPGIVTFGPYIKLVPGTYIVTVRFSSSYDMKAQLDFQGSSSFIENWPQVTLFGHRSRSEIFYISKQITVKNDVSNFESRINLLAGSIEIYELIIEGVSN